MRYDIRVRGSVREEVVAGLGDVTAVESGMDTVLRCRVPDVAALAGLLRALAQAGLVIRELRKVDPGS
ncbi:hypothetical protein OCAE111667_22040 [Occultella aeris]|uniref:Uncharacterized protein n=1 Tax=Occultella aeris TaxID=2761496 RepID=A0A7M4DQI0_9MICO|nr:hypothetical protein [Occultella aeris]VZO39724.1 hypothetical protein HALOF300_04420 [Occultella aeris]